MINPIKKMKEKKQQARLAREEEARIKAQQEAEKKAKEKKTVIIIAVVSVIAVIILGVICGIGYGNAIDGKIRIPVSSDECENLMYTDVEQRLKEAGFTNVTSEPMDDLVTDLLKKENKVDHISINGITDSFSSGEYYEPDYIVIIYYHSFPVIETTTKSVTETTTQVVTEIIETTTSETTNETTTKKKSGSEGSGTSNKQNSNSNTNKKSETNNQKQSNNKSNSECKYILNTNSKKFHRPNCSRGPKDTSGNKKESNLSREELINQGYEPCKICNP